MDCLREAMVLKRTADDTNKIEEIMYMIAGVSQQVN